MNVATDVMLLLATVVFLYNLFRMAAGPEYPPTTFPNKTAYEEKGGTWPETEGD